MKNNNLYPEYTVDYISGHMRLIDSVAEKLKQNVKFEELLMIKWKVL